MGKVNKIIRNKSKNRYNTEANNKASQLKHKNKINKKKSTVKAFKKLSHTFSTMEILKKGDSLNSKSSPKQRNLFNKRIRNESLDRLVHAFKYIPDGCSKTQNKAKCESSTSGEFPQSSYEEPKELKNLENVRSKSHKKRKKNMLPKQEFVHEGSSRLENEIKNNLVESDGPHCSYIPDLKNEDGANINRLNLVQMADVRNLKWVNHRHENGIEGDVRKLRMQRKAKRRQDVLKQKSNRIPVLANLALNPKVDFHIIDETKVLLIMCHPFVVFFCGIVHVKVLTGEIEILGYSLDQNSHKQPVYSPRGANQLSIKTKRADDLGDIGVQNLLKLGLSEDEVKDILLKLNKNSVVAVLEKDSSNVSTVAWPYFVERYSQQRFLPSIPESCDFPIEKVLNCTFEVNENPISSNRGLYVQLPEWDTVLERIFEGHNQVALCGGKSVGKSTLLRYLINQSLTKWESVLVIDCDPGQPEFFVPGCISAFHVKSPLLGPSFTHLTNPEKSIFLGSVDVLQCSEFYLNSVEQITLFCRSQSKFENIPWFINTMGFNKGLGIVLTSTVIKKVSPSLVVQINSVNNQSNFPSSLTPDFVESNLYRNTKYLHCGRAHHILLEIGCAYENQEVRPKYNKRAESHIKSFSAPVLRSIMILSHFGKVLNNNMTSIFDVIPYRVDYTKLQLSVAHQNLDDEDLILDVMNGNMVAMCHRSERNREESEVEEEYDSCLGFGIVRGVSKTKKVMFIITPLSEKKLEHVNCLIKGAISLPEKVYTDSANSVLGLVPYVMDSSSQLRHSIKRKFHKTKQDKSK